ncbi:MAG TPA: hypothetical protein VFV20_01860 [Candidatus Limnocylindria bacterium]|nr:hypothetical protein [Candidatus Limnocylindria bacterium]
MRPPSRGVRCAHAQPTIGERAAFVTAVLGVALGALFLFAPIHGYCMTSVSATPVPPGATPGPVMTSSFCGSEALWQRQPLFPMPFFAVLVWSLAPLVVYVGVRLRAGGERNTGTVLAIAGFLLECTVLISFGAAPFFAPFVLLPLVITMALAFRVPSRGS